MYSGWKLSEMDRNILLTVFPPRNERILAHHITHSLMGKLPEPVRASVIGFCVQDGLEALVVEVNGSQERLDGSTYHITWSCDPTRFKPKDSNAMIKERSFVTIGSLPLISVLPFWVDRFGTEHFE